MHRIDTPTAGPGNSWLDADPQLGQAATVASAAWFQSLQEEVGGFIESRGIPLDKGNNDQLRQAIESLLGAPVLGKNYLLNASFEVRTRVDQGAIIAQTGQDPFKHACDAWRVDPGTNGGGNAQIGAAPLDLWQYADIVAGSYQALTLRGLSTPPTSTWALFQRIENAGRLQGRVVTLSGRFRCRVTNTTGYTVTPKLIVNWKRPAAAFPQDEVVGQTFAVDKTGAWFTLTWTFVVPSGVGIDLEFVRDSYVEVRFEFSAPGSPSSDYIEVTAPQLELGNRRTDFERVPREIDTLRCSRYFKAHAPDFAGVGTVNSPIRVYGDPSKVVSWAPQPFPVPFREVSGTITDDLGGAYYAWHATTPVAGSVHRLDNATNYFQAIQFDRWRIRPNLPSGAPAGAAAWEAGWAIWDKVY